MKTLSPQVLDLFDTGAIAIRGLVKVILPSGTYGLWNGTGEEEFEGISYKPNSLISADEVAMGIGTSAIPFDITVPESANFGVTPDLLAGIENEHYKNAVVVIYDAYYEPNTRNLLHVEPMRSGYIDTIDHNDDGQSSALMVHCEDHRLDGHRNGYRTASHADQQLVSVGDKFFEYASEQTTEKFYFGRSG